jgi:TPR repeat protein
MSEHAPAFDVDALVEQLQRDPAAALTALRDTAQRGDPQAQYLLGQACMEGRGMAQDLQAGMHWFERAANAGLAMAMNMLGRCHELGSGTPANPALAAVWYRKAAGKGLDWGMYNLANLLGTGRGVARDNAAAFALYLRAARLGHAKSMNLVGRCLEEGAGVDPDPAAAPAWYRRSAEAGDFRGQASHASLLLAAGEVDAAVMWLRRALAQGSPSFLAHTLPTLAASPYPQVRALAAA